MSLWASLRSVFSSPDKRLRKVVCIRRGDRGRYRWFAYMNGVYRASEDIQGSPTPKVCVRDARQVLGRGWVVKHEHGGLTD